MIGINKRGTVRQQRWKAEREKLGTQLIHSSQYGILEYKIWSSEKVSSIIAALPRMI